MGITRTPIVDDDGSGTTGTIINNAWKQELYNQIDAQEVSGSWTPNVGGTATYTTQLGRWVKRGLLVTFQMTMVINTIGTGSPTTISGLPYAYLGAGEYASVSVGAFGSLTTPVSFIGAVVTAKTIQIIGSAAPANAASFFPVFGNGSSIYIGGSYFAF